MVRSRTKPKPATTDTWWLPRGVVTLRGHIFEKVNGDHTVTLPSATHGSEVFERVYAHPAVNGRSAGAGLSDLFWYWLSPGPEVHQEHLEPGERYEDVAATTRQMLAGSSAGLTAAATRAVGRMLDAVPDTRISLVRLRDLVMPAWAEFCYELVFKESCPPHARDLITAHADDVISALKCTGLRHPRRRARLTSYLRERVEAGDVPYPLPTTLSPAEQVHFLQGTMFNTAVVQLSEATAHVLLALSRHPEVQQRVTEDTEEDRYLTYVLDETMRLYPLFGIAHRITTGEVPLDEDTVLPTGSVVCFSYPDYHATGYDRPDEFDPDRWATLSVKDAHHIPFGVAANRPCPAWRLSPLVLRAAVREVLRRFRLDSTAAHTRSIPHRAPCLLIPRGLSPEPRRLLKALRSFVRVRDGVEDVTRGVRQLVLGTAMVLHSRRQRLTVRYFEEHPVGGCPVAHPEESSARQPSPPRH
ncbi:cytochrome P450 [Streptomyces aurantiacus]|uniref:cytochrome P450 n=1 Tax=Streptomyces aurantiacus TaxID=47760 RepID=UPI0006E3445D|nr:cytochrome P450 [Streptomyces aurantiacus]